jgi:3-methyladenine DNA glycosylase AlkC
VQGFDPSKFERQASEGLRPLELKARIAHVAEALDDSLAGPFEANGPSVANAVSPSELGTWAAWPAVEWVALAGLDHPQEALGALGEMTRAASAEFAIRPFIERHPELTWERLHEWVRSADEHRRRLASEGTRPRLPWGRQVATLKSAPERGIALLDLLRDDESEYVRRSVANHLNDVCRDQADLGVETAARWVAEGGAHVNEVVHRGLRGLVKQGDPRALALVGADVGADIEAELALEDETIAIGESLPFTVTLTLAGDTPSQAVVDYAVIYARPSGRSSRKVFKLAQIELTPGRRTELRRKLKLADVSIRTHHPGEHTIELLVNGVLAGRATFELSPASG